MGIKVIGIAIMYIWIRLLESEITTNEIHLPHPPHERGQLSHCVERCPKVAGHRKVPSIRSLRIVNIHPNVMATLPKRVNVWRPSWNNQPLKTWDQVRPDQANLTFVDMEGGPLLPTLSAAYVRPHIIGRSPLCSRVNPLDLIGGHCDLAHLVEEIQRRPVE